MVFEELKQLAAQSECPEMQRFPGTLAQFADESVESVVIMYHYYTHKYYISVRFQGLEAEHSTILHFVWILPLFVET